MASTKRVTRIGVYQNGKLITEQDTAKYTHANNTEQGHGFDGANYYTDGNHTSMVDFTTITPKSGHEATTLREAVLTNSEVELALTVEGGIEKVTGRLTERAYDSDSKSGMVKCSWKFIGGKPTVI